MLTLAETEHQEIINKFGGEFEFRIGTIDTEDIDFTNEATIKFAESKETFEINYNEQKGVEGPLKLTGHLVEDSHNNTYDSEAIKKCLMIFDEETNTWSLEMVGSSYHVSKGEFDNFETSSELQEFAKEFDFTMRQSSEDDGMVEEVEYNYNSGDSVLDSEFAELATMMKTSLNQENGINNLNRPVSLEQYLGGGGDIFKYSLNENAVSGVFISLIDRIWFGVAGFKSSPQSAFLLRDDDKEEFVIVGDPKSINGSMELRFIPIGKNGGKSCSREYVSNDGRLTNESSISKTALAFSSVNLFFDGDHCDVHVPVVGGHSGMIIVPLLSKISSPYNFTQDQIFSLTNHIQFGGDEVVKAKDNTGSATLSMAYTINLDADQRR
ncbi:14138_t:CDS:10 [Entrophospora sp. SA101]|nr:14138_t:CDS:10 [Entrophospora sp. SA101]